jgi:hypothetical protein
VGSAFQAENAWRKAECSAQNSDVKQYRHSDRKIMNWPHTNGHGAKNLLVVTWLAIVPPGILIALYLNLPFYVGTLNESILPKYFYFAFALLLSPLVFLKAKNFISYLISPIALWAISLIVLNCLYLLTESNATAVSSDLVMSRIQRIGIIILLGFAFTKVRRDMYEKIFVLLAVFVPCTVIADFLYPGIFYSADTPGIALGRAAAWYINSTNASEAILVIFILACPSVSKRYRSPLIILCGIGVMLTFSRAGMGAWLLIFAYLLIRGKLTRTSAIMALIVASIPLMSGGLDSYLHQRADLDQSIENIENRLSFLSKQRYADHSAIERAAVLEGGWKAFLNNPVTGIGAGKTMHESRDWPYKVSTHNQLILLAAEYGISGVLAWCWLGFCLMRGKYFQNKDFQRLMTLFFLMMTPFTHNMFDLPYWLLTFMLVAQQPARIAVRIPFPTANLYINRIG